MKFEGGLTISALSIFIVGVFIFFPTQNYVGEVNELYKFTAIYFSVALFLFPLEAYIRFGNAGLFRGNVLIVTSIVYWSLLDLLQGRYNLDVVQMESVKYSFVALAFFAMCVIVFSNLRLNLPRQLFSATKTSLDSKLLFNVTTVCFLLGVFYFFYSTGYDFEYTIKSLNKSRFRSPWARGISGGFDAILEHLKYFGYVLPAMTSLIIIAEKKISFRVVAAVSMMFFFSAFEFQGGGRRITGFLLGSFILTFLIYYKNKLKIYHFALVGASAVLLLVLLDMQLQFRNTGYENMFETYDIEKLDEIRVDDNFLRLAQIIEMVPSLFPHSGVDYLVWSFARPIPRALWPGKPLGPGFDVAQMVGAKGVSLTATVVGEAYASFGFFMIVLVAAISGILSGTLNQLLDNELGMLGVAFYALGALAMVAGVRALVDLIIFSYAFLGLFVVYKFFLRRNRGAYETNLALEG